MLARRVILSLCFVEGVLFRTKRFVPDYRYTQSFSWAGDADELVLIDVTPSGPWAGWAEFLADYTHKQGVDIPVTANCRVPDVEYARRLLNSGADKLLVNFKRKDIYRDISWEFGAQALVAGIDFGEDSGGGCESGSVAASESVALGAGEILLTSIVRDGSLTGYDMPALRDTVAAVRAPVIVSGGCGSWPHIKAAFEAGAQGACTSVIQHLTPTAMRACKQWLAQNYSGPIREAEAA